MPSYQLTTGGVMKDGTTFVPNDTNNREWQLYQTWVGGGNTATAATASTLEQYQAAQTVIVNAAAEGQRVKWLQGPGHALVQSMRFAEAEAMAGDGSPSGGTYPMCNAEVGTTGVNLAAVGTAVRAERATLAGHLAAIEAVRVVAVAAISVAGSKGAVDAAVAAAVWP